MQSYLAGFVQQQRLTSNWHKTLGQLLKYALTPSADGSKLPDAVRLADLSILLPPPPPHVSTAVQQAAAAAVCTAAVLRSCTARAADVAAEQI